jgi:hypothetical protein
VDQPIDFLSDPIKGADRYLSIPFERQSLNWMGGFPNTMRAAVGEIPAGPLPYGEGREAQRSRSALSRPECQEYQDCKRVTHPKAIKLSEIIEGPFGNMFLKSITRDIGVWTPMKCLRDWRRIESPLLCCVMNYPYLKDR